MTWNRCSADDLLARTFVDLASTETDDIDLAEVTLLVVER
jgi:hypothetical protein